MNALYDLIERKWFLVALGVVAGLVLGIFYGWVIDPVEWTDGTPADLRADLRVDYLRMVIDSYSVNQDIDQAVERYQRLGEYAKATLEKVGEEPGEVSATAMQNFVAAVEIFEADLPAQEQPPEEGPAPSGGGAGGAGLLRLVPWLCGGVVLIGVLLGGGLLLRQRLMGEAEEPVMPSAGEDFEPSDLDVRLGQTLAPEEPLATYRTTYTAGDDLYDDSFSVESPVGDFLGECGVGIADIADAADPKKVSSLEVWLFDKNDIQTVTKVLMSREAYSDEGIRTRLAAKGEPVVAEPGGVVDLETASLRVEARIVELTYGDGSAPPEGYFERITIEIRAWVKNV